MSHAIQAPKTTRHLEQLQRLVKGEIPAPPIATLVGFTATDIGLGHSVMEMTTDGRHANPMGTLHGGVVCDLSDAAMGTAMATTLEDDETFTTLDLNAKYFKPVWNAHIRAAAHVVKRTRSLGLVECDVTDDAGSLVAKVYSTCMVLRGTEAEGR
jgi:uncharacterized protein (TIGR00369 family)